MKKAIIALIILPGYTAFADEDCSKRAVTLARTSSNQGKLASLTSLPVAKDYLVGYRVQLVSSDGRRSDSFRIVLMRSSCSTVSMIREF